MIRLALTFFSAFFAFSISAIGAAKPLTLAEKLEIARKMADEAADGKAQAGRVVSGEFSFSEVMSKYRAQSAEATEQKKPSAEPISDDNDITKVVRIKEEEVSRIQRIESETTAAVTARLAQEAKEKIESAPEPVIEVIARPADFPASLKKTDFPAPAKGSPQFEVVGEPAKTAKKAEVIFPAPKPEDKILSVDKKAVPAKESPKSKSPKALDEIQSAPKQVAQKQSTEIAAKDVASTEPSAQPAKLAETSTHKEVATQPEKPAETLAQSPAPISPTTPAVPVAQAKPAVPTAPAVQATPSTQLDSPDDEKKSGGDGKSVKSKYVVDTSGKDFVNGFYVGKIDDKQVKTDKLESKKDEPTLPKKDDSALPKKEEPRYFNTQNALFYLVSDDYDAISVGTEFIKACAEIFNDYFGSRADPVVFTRRITLQLVADKDFEMQGQFSVITYDSGEITLAAKWCDDLDFDGFCKLLTGAALRKVMLENGGGKNWKNPPYWLELAFAQALSQKMRFGTATDLARVSAENPPKSAAEILAYSREDGFAEHVKDANAYWLLKSAEKAARTREMLASFMKFAIFANSPQEVTKAMDTAFAGGLYDFDIWWRCLFTGEVWARMGGVSSPDWSDAEIMRFAVIQTDSKDGERVGVSDMAILENRNSIAREISNRLIEIKLALMKINPLYHNTLVSLGRMYETAADGDEEDFKAAHAQFLTEFRNSRTLAERVKVLMQDKTDKK